MRGGLQVFRPSGEQVTFPTRKTGALLAVLALKKGHAVSRAELAEILWPGVAVSKQLVSLRQAIRNLQLSLGEDSPVIVVRDSCRIDPDRVVCPDVDEPVGVLLPEMTEIWFDDVRRSEGSVEPHLLARGANMWSSYHRQSAAALGLIEALEWASINRPRECLRMARSLPELIEIAPPQRLAKILDRTMAAVRPDDPLYGWGLAIRGLANVLVGQVDEAVRQMTQARSRAWTSKDRALYVMSSFYLTACQILNGQHEQALATIKEAKRLRLENVDHYAAVRLRHGLGLALCHNGEFRAGLRELWVAHDESEERTAPYEHAYVTANLAWFEATVGSVSKSKALIAELRELPAGDSWRLELTALVAQAHIAYVEQRYEESIDICRRIISAFEVSHLVGVNIYAYEILALVAHAQKNAAQTEEAMRKVLWLRQEANYGTTNWDRARLGPLASWLDK